MSLLLHECESLTDFQQVEKLRNAIAEYDNDRWRVISGKVGNGFSASACKDKAVELETEDAAVPQDEDTPQQRPAHSTSEADAIEEHPLEPQTHEIIN